MIEIFTLNHTAGGAAIRIFDPSTHFVLDFADETWKLLASATTPFLAMDAPAADNLGTGRKLYRLAFELLRLHRGPLPKRFELAYYGSSTPAVADVPLSTEALVVQAGGRNEVLTRVDTRMGCRTLQGYAVQLMARLTRNGRPVNPLNGGRALFTADAATDVITSTAHGLSNGEWVCFSSHSGGTLPGGLAATTAYEVRDVTANTFKVAATSGGAAVDLTTNGSGPLYWDNPTVTFTAREHESDIVAFTKTLTAADVRNGRFEGEYPEGGSFTVDTGTDVLTSTAHGLANGAEIFLLTGPGGTLPGGLDDDLRKHVINATANTLQVSNISAGGAIDITSAGSGVFSWIPAAAVLTGDRLFDVSVSMEVGGESIEDDDSELVIG